MKVVEQVEYCGHTLLRFEHRIPSNSDPFGQRWLVIAPDGINVLGSPAPTEVAARAMVDRLLDHAADACRTVI